MRQLRDEVTAPFEIRNQGLLAYDGDALGRGRLDGRNVQVVRRGDQHQVKPARLEHRREILEAPGRRHPRGIGHGVAAGCNGIGDRHHPRLGPEPEKAREVRFLHNAAATNQTDARG